VKLRRGRIRKQLLDNRRETIVHWKLKKEAATVWTGNWEIYIMVNEIYFLARPDILKIINLVYDGREIVTSLYNSL